MATKETVLEDMQKLIDLANETTGESRTNLKEGVNDLVNVAENKQDKLTAGEGITIDENNVISSAGSSELYEHIVIFSIRNELVLKLQLYSFDSEPFSTDKISTLIGTNHSATGVFRYLDVNRNVVGVYIQNGKLNISYSADTTDLIYTTKKDISLVTVKDIINKV